MQELELRDFREGFGFSDDGVLLKKNKFGGYRKKEVEEVVKQLSQNCVSLQKAYEEKNSTFNRGIAKAKQEAEELRNHIAQLEDTLKVRETEASNYITEIEQLKSSLNDMEKKLDEVKHIRNDETLLKENLCMQEQIDENQRENEELRMIAIHKDEIINENRHEIEKIKSNAQSELNLAYKSLGFRMEKIKSMISDFQNVSIEIDKTIHKKLEEIARGND